MPKSRTPRQPKTVERAYVRDLRRISGQVSREIEKATRKLNLDVEGIDLSDFYIDIGYAEARVNALLKSRRVRLTIDAQARRISDWNAEEVARILRIDIRQDTPRVQALLESFRSQNVDLITKMATKQLDDMRMLVGQAATSGMRVETLRKRIQERFRVSKSRAALIARDQTLKANGGLHMVRQRDAGISEYIWDTSQDERVRDEHAALHGQRFSWTDPPSVGHPGEDYQCRCAPIAVIPALDTLGDMRP